MIVFDYDSNASIREHGFVKYECGCKVIWFWKFSFGVKGKEECQMK
jgi:hypothetical protein